MSTRKKEKLKLYFSFNYYFSNCSLMLPLGNNHIKKFKSFQSNITDCQPLLNKIYMRVISQNKHEIEHTTTVSIIAYCLSVVGTLLLVKYSFYFYAYLKKIAQYLPFYDVFRYINANMLTTALRVVCHVMVTLHRYYHLCK